MKSEEVKNKEKEIIKDFRLMCAQSLPPEIFEMSCEVISIIVKNRNLEVK